MEEQILDDLPINKSEQVKWAGFWVRVGATLIDLLALGPIIILNLFNLMSIKSLVLQLLLDLVVIAYKPFMEYKYGATFGKRSMNLKVVNQNFEKISLQQAVLRSYPSWLTQVISIPTNILLYQHANFESADSFIRIASIQADVMPSFINSSLSFVCVISILVVAFTSKKQGLHDMIAKTYCVYS